MSGARTWRPLCGPSSASANWAAIPRSSWYWQDKLPACDTAVLQHPGPIIEALNLDDAVLVLGRVSEQQKAALYQQALAYVFPGLYEGFGLMIVEAMQAGVPVITSRS